MRKTRRIPIQLVGALCLLLWPALAGAQNAGQNFGADLTEGNRALAKVSSHLLRARALAAAGKSTTAIAAAAPLLQLRDGLPQVAIRLERLTPELVERLRDRGLKVDSFHLDSALVYGRLDPADLDEIAAIAEVSTIRTMPRPRRRVGDVTGQGNATMRSADVQALGWDGTGVTVGLLSDSFNKTGLGGTVSGGSCACAAPGSTCATVVTGMDNQVSGDLPASIPILDDCTAGGMNCSFLTDEGAALGETIFDSAPKADFLFHSAFNDPGDFAGGITQLVNCGADLIIDDVGWTEQPLFQDGVIAQAAQEAVDAGVPYFSAAGNDATFGIHDAYKDNGVTDNACPAVKVAPDGNDLHDFGSSDPYARVTIPAGCNFYAELQWSEPFSGTLGPGAASDLDLYLLDAAAPPLGGSNILTGSITDQGCGVPAANAGDPIEIVFYENTSGSDMDVFLAVEHCCGDEGVALRILNFSFNCFPELPPFDFESGIFVDAQIYGHPAARDVIAVGAAFYGEIDSGGTLDGPPGQLDVEPFSSKGGALPFYFDGFGSPLPMAPELRHKPEITSVDGANTTFFGSDIPFDDPDSFPNFFGTSAAAPHATALAVLIWQITGELISPKALHQLIVQAVFDMETPGQDDLSGYGFADALLAARSLDDSTLPLIDDLEFDLDGGAFFTSPPGSLQRLQANDSLTLGDGDFTGLEGIADSLIFADGFESGDTSAWSN